MTRSPSGAVVPRSVVGIGIAPGLRHELAGLAGGRSLVIDYFATARCGVAVGDLTARFRDLSPGDGYAELPGVEGVRLFAEARLIPLLAKAGPGLDFAGPPFARHVAVTLERPACWLEFLERPGIVAGKGPIRVKI